MSKRTLRIAHSPDADDHLMFWALANGWVTSDRFDFQIHQADTQALNQLSETLAYDIIAVSAAHYPIIQKHYHPLRMGSSVGSGYGPVLVAPRDFAPELLKRSSHDTLHSQLQECLLLTPGRHTTAHNSLKALGFSFQTIQEVPITPMELIFQQLEESAIRCRNGIGPVPVALLIHEGRLIFEHFRTLMLLDLGNEWKTQFGCDLPLGINVIKRSLDSADKTHLSQILRDSMSYGLTRRQDFETSYLAKGCPLSPLDLKKYLDMYANSTTLDIKPEHKIAFETLLSAIGGVRDSSGHEAGIDWI